MSVLLQKQQHFSRNIAKLINWCNQNGIEVTIGEVLRTPEQEAIYVRQGLSKTMNSRHLIKLAADLYFFNEEGKQLVNNEIKPIAEYWKSLSTDNVAGYDWGWDKNHFESKPI